MRIALLLLCAAGLYGQSISFTAPASDGDTIAGDGYTLTISTTSAPTIATVEYTVGYQLLGVVHASPWSLTYDFQYYFADGSLIYLVATARDYAGATVATATRRVRINNHSNNITTAMDLTATFSGNANFAFTGTSGSYCVESFDVSIDGDNYWIEATATVATPRTFAANPVPTTRYPNGTHELSVTTRHKDCSVDTYYEWAAMGLTLIDIQNSHTLSEIIPTYEQILVSPSSPFTLGCKQVFTDDAATDQNSLTACTTPSYSSSDTAVATVNSSTGVITGVAAGFADITISAHSKTAKAHVWVRASAYIPHFAKNGTGVRTSYLAGTSQFMVAPFIMLASSDTSGNATHLAAVRRAGMTTTTGAFWVNPSDSAQNFSAYDYASWKATYDANVQTGIDWATTYNFTLLGTADSGFSSQVKAKKVTDWAHGQQAVQYAASNFANSGRSFILEFSDEVNGCYGNSPDPPRFIGETGTIQSISCTGTTCTVTWPSHGFTNGWEFFLQGSTHAQINTVAGGAYFVVASAATDTFTFTPNSSITATINSSTDPGVEYLWWDRYGCGLSRGDLLSSEVISNTVLSDAIGWINAASPTVAMTLPPRGDAALSVWDRYGGKTAIAHGMADYASHYWSDGEKSQPYGSSASSIGRQVLRTIYERGPYTNWDRPNIWISNMNSKGYYKQSDNATYFYDPTVDRQDTTGNVPPASVIGIAVALAGMSAGIRPYNIHNMYDRTLNAAQHGAGCTVACPYIQTGAGPVEADLQGQRVFFAEAHMTSLIRNRLEPFLLGNFENCPGLGRNTVTTCRSNAAGDKLVMVGNMNDAPRTITVDLSAYKTSGVNITRYEVTALKTATPSTSSSATQTLSMAPGSVMFFICPVSSSTSYITSTTLPISTSGYPTTAHIGVMTDHIFSETMVDRSDYTACSGTTCTVSLDRTQDVYYKYVLTDSGGTPLFTSSPTLLSALNGTSVSTRGAVKGRGQVKTR